MINRTQTFQPKCGFFVIILCVIVTLLGGLAHITERAVYNQQLQEDRTELIKEASLMAARLQSRINSSFYLISGLASYIGIEKDITQEEYVLICENLFPQIPGLVNIATAPDLINQYVYPLEGNQMIIGMSYGELPEQVAAVERVRSTRKPVIAGPVELVQGGEAIIGRFPVFTDSGEGEMDTFWGIISTPIRTRDLYASAELPIESESYQFAIRGRDGLGASGDTFLGEEYLFYSDSVIMPVELVSGAWELALKPLNGWPKMSTYAGVIYTGYAAIALLSVFLGMSICLYLRRIAENQEVERSVQRVKERFYMNMSHEIRTPLNAIYGMSELIKDSSEEAETQANADMICQSAYALTELITDVLFLSEDAVSTDKPPCVVFNANQMLDDIMATLLPEMHKRNLDYTLIKLPQDRSDVCTSKQHFRQILWNLSLNAVKFTQVGSITLELSLESGSLSFRCTDTGIGIEESFKDRMFEAFTQEDDSDTRLYEGAGLGLTIVKRSVHLLNGSIRFESTKEIGTTFWVEIPLSDCENN